MVISQPPGNNPSYYYRASYQRCLNCSECFQRHLTVFYTCNYNIRVTHRNGAIKHIFYTNQIHGGIISRLLFIHFVAPCACSSSSGCITSNLSVWRFEHVGLTYICRLYFLQNASMTALVTQPILLSENIPNIWHNHQQKHKEVRPDWNDKNDNANYAPS